MTFSVLSHSLPQNLWREERAEGKERERRTEGEGWGKGRKRREGVGRKGEKGGIKSRLSTSSSPSGRKHRFLYEYSIMYQMICSTCMSLFALSSHPKYFLLVSSLIRFYYSSAYHSDGAIPHSLYWKWFLSLNPHSTCLYHFAYHR